MSRSVEEDFAAIRETKKTEEEEEEMFQVRIYSSSFANVYIEPLPASGSYTTILNLLSTMAEIFRRRKILANEWRFLKCCKEDSQRFLVFYVPTKLSRTLEPQFHDIFVPQDLPSKRYLRKVCYCSNVCILHIHRVSLERDQRRRCAVVCGRRWTTTMATTSRQ